MKLSCLIQLSSQWKLSWKFYATTDSERTCPICSEHHEKIYSIDDWEFKPPLHPNCRCTILSTVAEEYGLDNLEEGKSIDGIGNWFPSKKQAELELRYDDSLVKIFHDRKDKTVREIADEFDNIVSFQTIGKWIREVKKSEGRWITWNGRKIFISAEGKKISNINKNPKNKDYKFEATFEGLEDSTIPSLNKSQKVYMSTDKFDLKAGYTKKQIKGKSPHFNSPEHYLEIMNNPMFVREDINERGKFYLFARRTNKEKITMVIVKETGNGLSIETAYQLQTVKGIDKKTGEYITKYDPVKDYMNKSELIWENPDI